MNTKLIICLMVLFVIFPFMNACNTVQKQAYVKNGKQYGVTKGLFRGKWWSLYERGTSYREGGFLNEAEADLRAAIDQRSEDQRTARTYGMHFVDYFPHRELGITLYKKKLFQESIIELERSLSNEESAKAKFYLNKARKSKITARDITPPVILITAPAKNRIVNSFFIQLAGEVSDKNYVASLAVNGIPEFIELSGKTIQFKRKVALLPGSNQITITALDLLGNRQKKHFTVLADYQGPNLSVMNFVNNQQVDKKKVTLIMSYSDESGIEYGSIEGKKTYPQKEQSGIVSATLS